MLVSCSVVILVGHVTPWREGEGADDQYWDGSPCEPKLVAACKQKALFMKYSSKIQMQSKTATLGLLLFAHMNLSNLEK